MKRTFEKRYPGIQIVGTYSPPFRALKQQEDESIVQMINKTKPHFLWVGLGAMAEIVEDGRAGLHFTPGYAQDLAAKVEWAWNHPKEMEDMGREARKEYENKYTAEKNYEMLMEIYERAISCSH